MPHDDEVTIAEPRSSDPSTSPHWLNSKPTPQEEAEAFRVLLVEQDERGERPGWAYHQFIERFGHRPDVFISRH
jgi:hypothetical protein